MQSAEKFAKNNHKIAEFTALLRKEDEELLFQSNLIFFLVYISKIIIIFAVPRKDLLVVHFRRPVKFVSKPSRVSVSSSPIAVTPRAVGARTKREAFVRTAKDRADFIASSRMRISLAIARFVCARRHSGSKWI